jgi:GTP-binding protein Era
MVEQARQAVREADVALWVVDASTGLSEEDHHVAEVVREARVVVLVGINKIDLAEKKDLLPLMAELAKIVPDAELIPFSAEIGENLATLLRAVIERLPQGPRLYPEDEITDQTERAIVAEIIREKVMLETRDEVPYAVAVSVDSFEEKKEKNLVVIHATIIVERESQRPIVLGERGARIKAIGQAARQEAERFLGRRVFLELFVKVQPGWTKQPARLREFDL